MYRMVIWALAKARLFLALFAGLWLQGCTSFQNNSKAEWIPDQDWADSTAVEICKRMERLWGHRFAQPVTVEMIAADAKVAVLDSFPMAVRRDPVVRKLWLAIGLYRQNQSEAIAAGRLRQTATRALYLPRSRRILLVPIPDKDALEEALAHELIHAMQNEGYPLAKRLRDIRDEDEMVGFLGALEGQAEYLAPRLTSNPPPAKNCETPPGPMWLLSEAIRKTPQFSASPPALILPSYAPYVFGWQLACQVTKKYGLPGLDTLLTRPPTGSWQLWNSASYLSHQVPVDWDTAWSFLRLPRHWMRVGQARIGEIRLASLLLEWDRGKASTLLSGPSLGWRGDRLWVVRDQKQTEAFVWIIRFDSPRATQEFAHAWWAIQGLRMNATLPTMPLLGNTSGQWSDSNGIATQLQQNGNVLRLVHGFPEGLTRQILRNLARLRPTQEI